MLASASLGLLSSVFLCSVHVVQAMDNTCYFTEAQNSNHSQNLNLNYLSVEQACMNQNEYHHQFNEFNESASACMLAGIDARKKACEDTDGLGVVYVDYMVYSKNCPDRGEGLIGPNGETCQPANCTSGDFKILAYDEFPDGCTVGEIDIDLYAGTMNPYPEHEDEEENDYDEMNEKPDFDSDSDERNTCTISDELNMALMNEVQNGPTFQFISNCMKNMTKECEMGMLNLYSKACASTEGLTVRHVDFRVVSMNSGEHCQAQSEMIGPDGITCQPINCTPEDFMELVKGKFAEDCDVQVNVVNQRVPEPELEPEPEPEPEPKSDGDVDSESDSESFMCKDNADFRHIKEEKPNKKISCRNIGKKNKRRKKFCKDQDVNNACPQTCGTCCANAPMEEFKFTVKNNKKNRTMRKGCDWLGDQSDKRVDKYCKKKPVRAACAVSCNSCMEEIKANL